MKVYVLRHGIAAPHAPGHGGDYGRPLTAMGRKQLEKTGKALDKMGIRPDILASSPLKRAAQTARIISKHVGVRVQIWEELKPEMDAADALQRLQRTGADSAMVVGHEPHLTDMMSCMISCNQMAISLKKGALAYVRFGAPLPSTLRYMLTPKQMGMMV